MPGPKPKDPKVRQRRNKIAGQATLPPESELRRAKVPPMPEKDGGWTKAATEEWTELFRSPMREKFLKADLGQQRIYIDAVDRYWRGDTGLLAQIRQLGDNFGLSPMARRRLAWEIRDQHEAEAVAVGDGRAAPKKPRADTMNVLRGDFKK